MLIGHLPAGYLASTAALDAVGLDGLVRRRLLTAGLVASVAPDLDLLYFYGVDSGVHHHAFPTHWPVVWVGVALVGLAVAAASGRRAWGLGGLMVGAGGLLHLALDSVAGEVRWLAPASDWSLTLVTVPARFDSWVLSFLTHWTFGVELVLVALAVGVAWRRARESDRREGGTGGGSFPGP